MKTIEILKAALESQPHDEMARMALADLYEEAGNDKAAAAHRSIIAGLIWTLDATLAQEIEAYAYEVNVTMGVSGCEFELRHEGDIANFHYVACQLRASGCNAQGLEELVFKIVELMEALGM